MIGVYDSGFGGLSVLRHLRGALPGNDFVYLGDSGRAPYGGRDVDTLLDFSEQAIERLFEEGARLCIVACNTISCVALRHLQQRYASGDRRILGITIPGAELAVSAAKGGRIGVIATARTVQSGTYVTEIHKLAPYASVVQVAAPLLAPIVEEGFEDSDIARLSAARYLERLGDVDVLLLGCTHYPFLADVFAALVPSSTAILDPAPFAAERLVDWIERHPGFTGTGSGSLRVLCSGDPLVFSTLGARFLGTPLPPVVPIAEVAGRLAHRDPKDDPTGQVVRSGPRSRG